MRDTMGSGRGRAGFPGFLASFHPHRRRFPAFRRRGGLPFFSRIQRTRAPLTVCRLCRHDARGRTRGQVAILKIIFMPYMRGIRICLMASHVIPSTATMESLLGYKTYCIWVPRSKAALGIYMDNLTTRVPKDCVRCREASSRRLANVGMVEALQPYRC